jgi:hypothetical protein
VNLLIQSERGISSLTKNGFSHHLDLDNVLVMGLWLDSDRRGSALPTGWPLDGRWMAGVLWENGDLNQSSALGCVSGANEGALWNPVLCGPARR